MINIQQAFRNMIDALESIVLSKESEDTLKELSECLLKYGYIHPNKLLVIPPNSIKAALVKAGKKYDGYQN